MNRKHLRGVVVGVLLLAPSFLGSCDDGPSGQSSGDTDTVDTVDSDALDVASDANDLDVWDNGDAPPDIDIAELDLPADVGTDTTIDVNVDAPFDADGDSAADAGPTGLALTGAFIPSAGSGNNNELELSGSFAVSFGARPSGNGNLSLRHVVLGVR